MFRITRFRLAVVLLVVVGAFFIDGYSLIYRYLVVHEPLGTTLTSAPTFLGRQLYIHKGLDLQGGTELTIEICHGLDNPNSDCRNGPPNGDYAGSCAAGDDPDHRPARQLPRRLRGERPGAGRMTRSSCSCPVSASSRRSTRSARPPVSTSPPPSPAPPTTPPSATLISDQEGHYDTAQFGDYGLYYPTGYHWKIDNNLDATDVNSATVGTDCDYRRDHRRHQLQPAGASEWSKITTAAYNQYLTNTTNPPPTSQIAIFLDNDVLTAPVVTGGGQSNQTQITGNFTSDSATQLASLISAGALPAEITTVASTSVSATLGQQSVTLSLSPARSAC